MSLKFRVDSDNAQVSETSNIQDPQEISFPSNARVATYMGNSGRSGSAVLNLVSSVAPFAQDPRRIDLSTDRVVLGVKPQMQVLTVTDNLPPLVRMSVRQGDDAVVGIDPVAGVLHVRADVIDSAADRPSLTWDWSETSAVLKPIKESIPSFTPNISDLLSDRPSGTVETRTFAVSVSDGTHVASRSMTVRIERSEQALSAVLDSDGDGMRDADEGRADTDTDGIPNYLDTLTYDAHVLQTLRTRDDAVPDPDRALLATRPGLRLTLGAVALGRARETGVNLHVAPAPEASADDLRTQRFTARVPLADIHSADAFGGGTVPDDAVGVYDFLVDGIGIGDSVELSMPLAAPAPASPGYVQYRAETGRWQTFADFSGDSVVSLPGEQGLCPGPGETVWSRVTTPTETVRSRVTTPTFSEGHWCVRLNIRDGGPNDVDGVADGVLTQLVGFATVRVVSGIQAGSESGSGSGAVAGGGCTLSVLAAAPFGADAALAALLALCLLLRRRRAAPALAAAVLATAVLAPAGALAEEESWQEWGAGSSGLWRGVYAGAGLASTEIAPHVFGPRYHLSATRDSGPRLALGYRLASHWSLEGFWADLGEAEILDRRTERPASAAYRQRGVLLSYRRARPDWLGLGRGLEGLGVAWGWFVSAGWADQDAKCRGCEFSSVDEGQMTLGLGVDLATPGPWTVRVHYERYGDDSSAAALSWLFGAAASPRAAGGRR